MTGLNRRGAGERGREGTEHKLLFSLDILDIAVKCPDFFKSFSHTLSQPWHLAMTPSWKVDKEVFLGMQALPPCLLQLQITGP